MAAASDDTSWVYDEARAGAAVEAEFAPVAGASEGPLAGAFDGLVEESDDGAGGTASVPAGAEVPFHARPEELDPEAHAEDRAIPISEPGHEDSENRSVTSNEHDDE